MLSFLSFWTLAISSVDPLFVRMLGDWVGEGERIFVTGERRVKFQAKVSASIQGNLLISHNVITESSLGAARTYTRIYWLRRAGAGADDGETEACPCTYELGYGEDLSSENAAGIGQFDGTRFSVTQNLDGGLLFNSITEFKGENESLYSDIISSGGATNTNKISESRVRYTRTAATQPSAPLE